MPERVDSRCSGFGGGPGIDWGNGGEAVGTNQGHGPVARKSAAAQFPLSSQVCDEAPPSCALRF